MGFLDFRALALLPLLSGYVLAGQLGEIAQGAKGISLALDPQEPVHNTTAVLSRNCAYFGWFPDDGNRVYGSTGVQHTLQEINAAVGIPSFAVGGYAHQDNDLYDPLDASTHFNGSEWAQFLPEAVATNAIFVASLNPVHGYGGFMPNDTQNLDALITVLQAFVEQGVTVWLRYAFEFNWYTQRGSDDLDPNHRRTYYDPSVANFLSSWKLVYTRVKAALPSVQLMWCANTAPNDQIRPFWPGPDYVDITAIDYYTYLGAAQGDYYNILGFTQDFHDEFALPHNKSFFLGETGTRSNRTQDNLQWVKTCTSQDTCNAMANYRGLFWFEFIKNGLNHNVVMNPDYPQVAQQFVELMASP